MKKSALFMIFITILSLSLSASLLDIYKSGKLKLVPDPNFGKGTAWDIYFPQGILDIAFTKDGSFFATGLGNKACHCVYKFDKNGKFIKKIGRKGRGPGDLYAPGDLSILDNKYLLVGEYASSRRISVFDLNGNFVKIIKTRESVFNVVGLKNGIFVILSKVAKNRNNVFNILLKNIQNKTSKMLKSYSEKQKSSSLKPGAFYGEAYILRNKENNLIIGFSSQSKVEILSDKGDVLKVFDIGYKRREINEKERKAFYKSIEYMFKEMRNKGKIAFIKKLLKTVKFPDQGPTYDKIITDGEGNILIFRRDTAYSSKEEEIKIYNKNGREVNILRIKKTNYPEFFTKFWFNGNYIYYFDKQKDKLVREQIKPGLKNKK